MASRIPSSSPSMDEYSNNWDLHAVVRGSTNITNATTSDPFRCFPPHFFNEELVPKGEDKGSLFPDLETRKNAHHELEELYKPFFSITQQLPKETETRQKQTHRSNRKKNQLKKVVCQVPADDQSSDMWAWRKYGQKPIKGSPNPRGYYRCSSSKTCLARKQVERSRTDSTILIVTYTAEHNHPVPTHRNSLAGSTRNKFPPPPSKDNADQNLPSDNKSLHPLSILTMTGLSPTTSLTTSMEDELVMVKGDYEEENNDDDEDRGMMIKDDVGSMDLGKTGDVIDDEDFVQKFFSSIWQVKGSGVTDASGR